MNTAAPAPHARGGFPALLIRGGGPVFALPLESVAEVMRPLPIEPLGGMPAFVLGVSVIRGLPTPVADLTGLVGGVSVPPSRFVTVRANGRVVADIAKKCFYFLHRRSFFKISGHHHRGV